MLMLETATISRKKVRKQKYLCEEFLETADPIDCSLKSFLFAMGGKALLTGENNLQGKAISNICVYILGISRAAKIHLNSLPKSRQNHTLRSSHCS